MSERKINLKDIYYKIVGEEFKGDNRRINAYKLTINEIDLKAMKEACRQALELAVIKIKADAMETFGTDIPDCWNEQSILDTINQVE